MPALSMSPHLVLLLTVALVHVRILHVFNAVGVQHGVGTSCPLARLVKYAPRKRASVVTAAASGVRFNARA